MKEELDLLDLLFQALEAVTDLPKQPAELLRRHGHRKEATVLDKAMKAYERVIAEVDPKNLNIPCRDFTIYKVLGLFRQH